MLRPMVGVDLFSGAGGMSLGASLAGVDVQLAVEADPHAAWTYTHNHPRSRVFPGDIRRLKEVAISSKRARRVLFGGPPCQGFSTSNQRTRTKSNPCNWLFLEFMRVARLWRPDWVVFENVRGIVDTEKGFFLHQVLEHLEDAGYAMSWFVLNAADFGVPQVRSRLFVVGSLHGHRVPQPRPSAARQVTVQDAIGDLPDLPNGASVDWMPYGTDGHSEYALQLRGKSQASPNHLVTRNSRYVLTRYRHVPQGGNWEDIPPRLMKNYADRSRCHTGIYHRLRPDRPSVVIGNFRKNMLIHPCQHRGLSVREAARLQSFPDWYEFKGSVGFQQQQVGNAVPPLLAKVVFEAILGKV